MYEIVTVVSVDEPHTGVVGASGGAGVVVHVVAADQGPLPTPFTARTRTSYGVTTSRPLYVWLVPELTFTWLPPSICTW